MSAFDEQYGTSNCQVAKLFVICKQNTGSFSLGAFYAIVQSEVASHPKNNILTFSKKWLTVNK